MIRKILIGLFGLMIAFGLFVLLGTAGASDLDTIDSVTCSVQIIIGLSLCVVGFFGLKVSDCEYIY